jgi:hypothetical protein
MIRITIVRAIAEPVDERTATVEQDAGGRKGDAITPE